MVAKSVYRFASVAFVRTPPAGWLPLLPATLRIVIAPALAANRAARSARPAKRLALFNGGLLNYDNGFRSVRFLERGRIVKFASFDATIFLCQEMRRTTMANAFMRTVGATGPVVAVAHPAFLARDLKIVSDFIHYATAFSTESKRVINLLNMSVSTTILPSSSLLRAIRASFSAAGSSMTTRGFMYCSVR